MQTLKFETQLTEGMVHLPIAYKHWQDGKKVRITIQVEDAEPVALANETYHIIELDEVAVFSKEELHKR